jgi:Fe-S-cluster containining protein
MKRHRFWTPLSKALARCLGYSGRRTLCAECYRSRRMICRFIKKTLGLAHCEQEATEYEAIAE